MADPVMPFDVLLMIMALLSRSDGLNMSMTCRTLRHGGARFLLEGGVALTTSGQAISLIKFIRADAGNCAHHLRDLKISGDHFSSKAVDALKGLVTTPHLALHSLVLTDAEAILMPDLTSFHLWDPRSSMLFSAFSSLATLKHLTIDRCDEHSFAFIRSLPSSLTTATLNLEPLTMWSVITDPDERNPILLLTNSSHTLVELCGTGFDIDPAIIKYDIVYPSVRRISAEYTSPAMPGTLAYIHAFPNLEYLSLTSPNNRFDDLAVDELEDPLSARPLIVDIRVANRDDQVNYGCTWHRLREVSGSLVDLYVLGIACQVPKVRILDTITEWKCTLLQDVLADVRPSCLVISFAGMSMFGTGGPLYWMLRELEVPLRALELEIRCSANEGAWSLGGIVVRVLKLIPQYRVPSRLTTLTFFRM